MSGVPYRVIAIDGPSGSGKSTLAAALAAELGVEHLDTGAMYRAVALAVLRRGLEPDDADAVATLARAMSIEVSPGSVVVNGEDATAAIRTPEVTAIASVVAANPDVRTELVRRQRAWVEDRRGGVVEGRDIASVVFPGAELKLYLTASSETRARRRAEETGSQAEATASEMAARDARDTTRAASPLVRADGSHEIDTTDVPVGQLVKEVLKMLDTPDQGRHEFTRLEHRVGAKVEYKPPTRGSLLFFAVCRAIAATICRLFCRVTVEGRENLPASGPYVFAPVHRSYVDWIVLACISRRRVRFMAKDTLWSSRFVGWLLEALGTFPVHRGSADRAAFSLCVKILAEGEPCVLFPEGQRRSGPVVEDLLGGAAYVAARARVPIVPVGIGGSERVMQKGKALPRPYKVHIVVGRPIYPLATESGSRVPMRVVKEITAQLQGDIQELFDRAQRRAGAA